MIFSLRSSLRMQNYADRPRRAIPYFRYFSGHTPPRAHYFSVKLSQMCSIRDFRTHKIASRKRRSVDVVRIAVPTFVEVLLIGIGEILHPGVHL